MQFVSLPCRRRLPGKCDIGTVCSLPAACFVSSSTSRTCPAETGFGFFLPGCHLLFPLLPSAALSYCVFFLCRLLMSLTGISDCIHLQWHLSTRHSRQLAIIPLIFDLSICFVWPLKYFFFCTSCPKGIVSPYGACLLDFLQKIRSVVDHFWWFCLICDTIPGQLSSACFEEFLILLWAGDQDLIDSQHPSLQRISISAGGRPAGGTLAPPLCPLWKPQGWIPAGIAECKPLQPLHGRGMRDDGRRFIAAWCNAFCQWPIWFGKIFPLYGKKVVILHSFLWGSNRRQRPWTTSTSHWPFEAWRCPQSMRLIGAKGSRLWAFLLSDAVVPSQRQTRTVKD